MREFEAGGNKHIKEIEKLRVHVVKLEQVNRRLANHKSPDEELDRAWHEGEKPLIQQKTR